MHFPSRILPLLAPVLTLATGPAVARPGPATMSDTRQKQPLAWNPVAPGVWAAQAGTPEAYNLLVAAGSAPNTQALGKLPAARLPLDPQETWHERRKGRTYLRFPLGDGEEIHGLGLDFNSM